MNPGKHFLEHSFITKRESLATDELEAPGNSTISYEYRLLEGEKLEGSN
jgi:hypothetical protein